jgi:hypothetical protein
MKPFGVVREENKITRRKMPTYYYFVHNFSPLF